MSLQNECHRNMPLLLFFVCVHVLILPQSATTATVPATFPFCTQYLCTDRNSVTRCLNYLMPPGLGGRPYEIDWDVRCLAWGCKLRILVSTRMYGTKRQYF